MSAAPTLPPLARSGKVTGWMIRRAKWWQELSSGCSSPRGASALGSLRRRLQLPNHIRAETSQTVHRKSLRSNSILHDAHADWRWKPRQYVPETRTPSKPWVNAPEPCRTPRDWFVADTALEQMRLELLVPL